MCHMLIQMINQYAIKRNNNIKNKKLEDTLVIRLRVTPGGHMVLQHMHRLYASIPFSV